ncbi:MAG: hypothetical protein ACJ746_20230 [Bryobacteraceae bacterium]
MTGLNRAGIIMADYAFPRSLDVYRIRSSSMTRDYNSLRITGHLVALVNVLVFLFVLAGPLYDPVAPSPELNLFERKALPQRALVVV